MIDLSAIVNSIVGSLAASVLVLLISTPIWWRWWRAHVTKLKSVLFWIVIAAISTGIIVLSFVGRELSMEYQERTSIPQYHVGLTNEEQTQAFAKCEMKSLEATANIQPAKARGMARRKHRAACLIEEGFRWRCEHEDRECSPVLLDQIYKSEVIWQR